MILKPTALSQLYWDYDFKFQVSHPDGKPQLTVWIICLLLGTTCKVVDAP